MKIKRFFIEIVSIFYVLSSVACTKDVDENPIVDPHRLVGEYRNSTRILVINEDKTYNEKIDVRAVKGAWSIQDSYLTLAADDVGAYKIKVLEVDGVYHLLVLEKEHQDPDTWDWSQIMKPVSKSAK